MKLQSAAQLKAELEAEALANFPVSPRFGLTSPQKRRDFAERSGLSHPLLVLFLDFQQKWETALQVPLSLVFPFRVEVGDISAFFHFNKEQSGLWLFPFARDAEGFILAFWTFGLWWPSALIVSLDENWHEEPHVVSSDLRQFFLETARAFSTEDISESDEVRRDFILWTQEHIRVVELSPEQYRTMDITEWPTPELPDFAQWCKQMMR